MLRNVFIHEQKAVDATLIAHADLVTGMGVVRGADGKTAFPAAATSDNIFVVDKLRIADGVYASNMYLPDSHDAYVKVASGDRVKLRKMTAGEMFDVDQVASTAPAAGAAVSVGTDGKWAATASGKSSIYVCRGTVLSAGKTLYRIEVLDTAITVA